VLAHRGFVPDDAEGIVENTVAAFAAAHAIGASTWSRTAI
jgi:glycerophosphoryl diester phosphodiesterase